MSFQYFLRKKELPLLHRAYDIYYENVLQKNALDALKVTSHTPSYVVDGCSRQRITEAGIIFKMAILFLSLIL